MENKMADFISRNELAASMKTSRSTISGWEIEGLAFYQVGKARWYRLSEVAEFLIKEKRREGRTVKHKDAPKA